MTNASHKRKRKRVCCTCRIDVNFSKFGGECMPSLLGCNLLHEISVLSGKCWAEALLLEKQGLTSPTVEYMRRFTEAESNISP